MYVTVKNLRSTMKIVDSRAIIVGAVDLRAILVVI